MVWAWAGYFGYVPAGARVHRENRGDVAMDVGLPACAPVAHYLDGAAAAAVLQLDSFDDAL